MLRTGKEFLESIRDGRKVYLGGELVGDVTTHPAFRNAAQTFAMIFDRRAAPENRDVMTFEEDGARHATYYLKPKTKDDLRRRTETHRRIASWTYGLLGRSPDHVASYVTGLSLRPDLFEGNRKGFGDNLVAYQRHMRDNDICATYTVLPPQGSRKPEFYNRTDVVVPTLRVVAEKDDGIVISGMKMLGTSAVFANETWVGNVLPLSPSQKKEAVTCAVPLNAPGVRIWSRKSFERAAVSEFDNPLSYRFDETDSMVIFKDVKVPWERVFILDDAELAREIYMRSPAHSMGNHQSTVRFGEKLKLLVAVAYKVAKMNGIAHIPQVQGTLSRLAAHQAGFAAMIAGQIEDCESIAPGYVNVNRRYMYSALLWGATNYYQLCDDVRELMGGGPFQVPADISVLDDPELAADFEAYWSLPDQKAVDRMKLMKLGWDLLGSEFAGRHTQYERFYSGPSFIVTSYTWNTTPWADFETMIDGLMASYDVPAKEKKSAAE